MLLLLLPIEATNPITHLHTSKKKVGNFFRIKDADSRGGIANGLNLPKCDEYDIFIVLQ